MANYSEMNKDELDDLARKADIEGRSSMNKDELVAALEAHGKAPAAPAPASEPAADRGKHGFV